MKSAQHWPVLDRKHWPVLNRKTGVGPAPANRTPSFSQYLSELQALAQSPLPSSDLKSMYRTHTAKFSAEGLIIIADVKNFLDAQMRALVNIARTETQEKGMPVPSDAALRRQIERALHKAAANKRDWLAPGTAVKVGPLGSGSTSWMSVTDAMLTGRRSGEPGTLVNSVPGHGRDVWFVEHADGRRAAYSITELELTAKTAKTPGKTWMG